MPVNEIFDKADIAVMAAAVADYTPVSKGRQKRLKRMKTRLTLELTKTKDILKSLGEKKKQDRY